MAIRKTREPNEQLTRACEIANNAQDVLAIEQEWDALRDEIAEPWTGVSPRFGKDQRA